MPAILLKVSRSLWHHPARGGETGEGQNLICITSSAQSSRATVAPAASCQVDKALGKLCWFISVRIWARGAIIRVSLSFQDPERQAAKLQQNQSCFVRFYARIPTSPKKTASGVILLTQNSSKLKPSCFTLPQIKTFLFHLAPAWGNGQYCHNNYVWLPMS